MKSLSRTIMTNYAALAQRIRSATTQAELSAREAQCDKHNHAGTITMQEFSRLDGKIMDQFVFIVDKLETNPTITNLNH